MRIVQVAPFIGPGSGVAGVAWNLGRELSALGVEMESFTFDTARRGRPDPIVARGRVTETLLSIWRTIWFSTIGTRRLREFLAERPDAVSIIHQNVTTGDIFVNHGVLYASFRARGHALWRLLRNPVHVYTYLRDRKRYRTTMHRRIVVLAPSEVATLTRTFGRVASPVEVISNGVDLSEYRPPTSDERRQARARFRLEPDARVALFIGYEFGRKGLPLAIEALVHAPTVLLLVVGGVTHMVEDARRRAERLGVADRVLLLGAQHGIRPYLTVADMFVMPSAYESSGLVYLEALASGLPIIATQVGIVPEVVVEGVNGFVVDRDPAQIGDRLERIAAQPEGVYASAARASVAGYSWRATASQYLALAERVAAEKAETADRLPPVGGAR